MIPEYKCSKEKEIDKLFIVAEASQVKQATMAEKLNNIDIKVDGLVKDLKNLPENLEKVFVSKVEFETEKQQNKLARKVVFGAVGLILTSVLIALLALIIIKG